MSKVSHRERHVRLRAIARRQQGCFTIAQAVEAGFPRSTVTLQIGRGAWEQLAPRVLRAAVGAAPSWRQRAMAAALSVDGVVSHRTAAALHGLCDPPVVPEVLVPRRSRGFRDRLGLHSTRSLPASDVTTIDGIPVTRPARTLIDFAGRAEFDCSVRTIDTAIATRKVRPEQLERRAREMLTPARRGAAVVIRALRSRHPELERARSQWEERMLRLCRRFGLPEARVNYPIEAGGRLRLLDIAWPEALVFVEFDGFAPHAPRVVFDDDRTRQNDLVDLGWQPFRLTSATITSDAERAFRPIVRTVTRRLAVEEAGTWTPDAA